MKVWSHLFLERQRVKAVQDAIGDAILCRCQRRASVKQALAFAESFADYYVAWFEEPVHSDDRDGLTLLRRRMPAGMDFAAGEYLSTMRA